MRKIYLLVILSLSLMEGKSQAPFELWQKKLDGSFGQYNYFFEVQKTVSGGYIVAGYSGDELLETSRTSGDLSTVARALILDSAGNTISDVFGPSGMYHSVTPINNGGFVMGGWEFNLALETTDVSLEMIGPARIRKLLGGSADDKAYSVCSSLGTGFMFAGFTRSNDGVVSGNHGDADIWIGNCDVAGNLLWQKCLGGSGLDIAYHITRVQGGYLIAGTTQSNNGNVTGNHGFGDGWLVKLDTSGNIIWQKCFGGTDGEFFSKAYSTSDGGIIAIGTALSNNGDVLGNHGGYDIWVVKCDNAGNIQWKKCYGGTGNDNGYDIKEVEGGGYIFTGATGSNDGDVNGNNGGSDQWVVKIAGNGNVEWQKCIGTTGNETGAGILVNNEFEYLVVGNGYKSGFKTLGALTKLGKANAIKGVLYIDNNNNGVKDADEPFYNDAIIKSTRSDGYLRESKPVSGAFTNFVDAGAFQTTVALNNPYYTVFPSIFNSSFPGYLSKDSTGFRLVPISGINDLQTNLLPIRPARPGFTSAYKLTYRNVGTVALSSVTIKLKKDSRCNVISTVPAFSSVNGDTLQWNITSLSALDSGSINITLQVQAPPAANNGDILQFAVIGNPIAGDQTPLDNTDTLYQTLVGSYDPNDKTETNGGRITQAQVSNGDYLNYVIRFQNTGNFSAINVDIRDTLDARLDWNSFEMISSSHTYALNITDGNKLRWLFNNINLPDSNHNEPASHGYIAYRIRPKSTVVVGDTIHNTAGIYFDFNLPVATNNAKTIVFNFSGLPVTLVSFNASLNGSAVDVSWKTAAENNAKQFDIQRSTNGTDFVTIGTVKAANAPSGQSYLYKDKNPVKGYNYYRLKSVDIDGSSKYSSTVLVNVSDGRDIISSIYPNPSNGQIVFKLQGEIKGNVQLLVMDQMGSIILAKQFGIQNTRQLQSSLELGRLAKGSYLLKIAIGDKVYNHKFLIQ